MPESNDTKYAKERLRKLAEDFRAAKDPAEKHELYIKCAAASDLLKMEQTLDRALAD